jgi:hypothetical protein
MAISWGAWEYASGNGMRVGLDISWTSPSSSSTTTVATVDIYTQNQFKYSDSQTLSYSGFTSNTATTYTNNTGPTSGTTPDTARLRATKTYTYTYSTYRDSPGTRTFTATVSGAFNGVTPSESVASTIPARPGVAPGAPGATSTAGYNSVIIGYSAPGTTGTPAISDYQYSLDGVNFASTSGVNPFTVSGLAAGSPYSVYVRAVNAYYNGSSTLVTSTPYTTPSAPTSFTGSNATFGQIALSWSGVSNDGGNGVTSYVLRSGSTVLQNSSATSYTHTSLSPYTDYAYTVTAVNGGGEGAAASVTVKTMGGVAKVWNGSAWVTTLPKVWNGTAWVDAQARMWNGTTWVHGI